jgi:hypothetical protein
MEHLIKDQHITTQFMDADIADTDKKFLEEPAEGDREITWMSRN